MNAANVPWIFLATLAGIVLGYLVRRAEGDTEVYDERQTAARGIAYRAGFYTFLFYGVLCLILAHSGVVWCVPPVDTVMGIALALTVFSVVAIVKDAYVALNRSPEGTMLVSLGFGLAFTVWGAVKLMAGELIADGLMTDESEILILGAALLIIGAADLIHRLRHRGAKEDGDEE